MRELSLFTGAGGGLLGTKLLGWEPIGYVEFNDYCQRVIRQRIIDGVLPNAPIFGDIRAFIDSGCAELYRGVTDVITGGFPCQPFSNAGKRLGAEDPRNMWPATIDCIRIIRPRYAFLENVPGLVTSGYFGTILGDLVKSGYDCKWRVLSAAEMGAPHQRDRLWIRAEQRNFLSYPKYNGNGWWKQQPKGIKETIGENTNTTIQRFERPWWPEHGVCAKENRKRKTDIVIANSGWSTEPDVGRVANGVAARVDRLKAIGNGQVPIVAATAWRILSGIIN